MGRSLEGRVALVTGASSGGTGRSIAVRFAAEGATVAINARSEAGLRETLAAIESVGSVGLVLPADLSDPGGGRMALVETTESTFGPIDILVNNAMGTIFKPIAEWTLADMDEMQQINVWTPWLLMGQLLPGMRARGRGWILNLTSSAAEFPPGPPYGPVAKAGYAGYGSTKAALSRLTLAAAAETEGQGVAVNALTPQAAIATPAIVSSGYVEALVGSDDVGWVFEPVDAIAEAALALCSGDPGVLTGRIAYSLQLLLELNRPVFDVRGEDLVPGFQPADLPPRIRRQIEFHRSFGGPDELAFNRPSTPLPAALAERD
jgi:NAD(P)-dependent dehydrogenase (short-subunit alcohol dehydrogenase family)